MVYKFLERIILRRLKPLVEDSLSIDQAGFRAGRSTQDQVLALSTFIENGFQQRLKTGAVFLDLTAAYDTVWHKGLLVKISKVLPAWAVRTIELLLQNRRFRVHMGDNCSSWRPQKNGLPQGSVLAPTLLNLYINDLPQTDCRKFTYADDICLALQAKTSEDLNRRINEDMSLISAYCKQWRLQPSVNKTVSSVFHLHNARCEQELDIYLNGSRIKHDHKPVYLGVTLDRTLTYKDHLQKTAAKIRTRNNLLQMLANTKWGADARTLRSTALALCFSVAEYCAPVWRNSAHRKAIDTQLNSSMRVISGAIKCTRTEWLPVLCNIVPPDLRREAATLRLLQATENIPNLPLNTDLQNHPRHRLPSRRPIWHNPPDQQFSPAEVWSARWNAADVPNKHLVDNPNQRLPGMELPRGLWTLLNRFRADAVPSRSLLHRWGLRQSPQCECGESQTANHIVEECVRTRFPGGLAELSKAKEEAATWLETLNLI